MKLNTMGHRNHRVLSSLAGLQWLVILGFGCTVTLLVYGCADDPSCESCDINDGEKSDSGTDSTDLSNVSDQTQENDGSPSEIPETTDVQARQDIQTMDTTADNDAGPAPDDVINDAALPLDSIQTDDAAQVILTDLTLVDHFQWVPVDTLVDPWFTDKVTPGAICDDESYTGENTPFGPWLDVDTSFCSYLTLIQPLVVAIPKGAPVTVRVKHDGITLGDGEYLVTLVAGLEMEVVAEWTQAVPAEPAVLVATWQATRDFTVGEPVTYHIHNHGKNRWSLTDCYVSVPVR